MPSTKMFAAVVFLLAPALARISPAVPVQKRPSDHLAPPSASVACPVTLPTTGRFTPPSPYPRELGGSGATSFWFGSKNLWTALPADGTWTWVHSTPQNLSQGQELFWRRANYNAAIEKRPALRITGKRLDAKAPPFQSNQLAHNGYRGDLKSFMVEAIDLPSPGCWQITGRYRNQELSFVVRVAGPAISHTELGFGGVLPSIGPPWQGIHIDGSIEATALTHSAAPVIPSGSVAHTSGIVVCYAVIGKGGDVRELTYLAGPASLMRASLDAARSWRYRPTFIDDRPVEVQTTIDVTLP